MVMARSVVIMVVLLFAVIQGSKAALCNIDDKGLAACKPSVTQPNPVEPSEECCVALSGADLTCLCSYRDSFMLPALGIDPDLAMGLPAKCNLTPPSTC
ncbi:hypothetical protein RJ640_025339 [Escallonia rubra]|uniref:Bifunctional inhibitor/plant lipid transfer protein/seed storage helical domain-containing protein n=1 Tax=Escallonia rubra TaxID=112253 RepID=A0AA88QIN6_9ASTE|nr:hypothetical protein RJ640_025338 [Escallonia rubra]KAK2971389.1 hypothetical protein RJ640_025339 [Escallonia rubra]